MFTLNCKGRLLVVDKPLVMGIINATPDSFYGGSRQMDVSGIVDKALQMIAAGADIIDIGGQSTRPGSERVAAAEEWQRVAPAIEGILKNFPDVILSIDTYHAFVAKKAVEAGACIVNDISAGSMDKEMISTVAELQVPYVLMHMKGTPETMQSEAVYEDVAREVFDFFIKQIDACKKAGITDIILDPGFGFAKTIQHNFELLRHLQYFQILPYPLLAGLSRKASIYKTLGIKSEEALNGTTVMNTIALMNGAKILRVHDVKEAKETIRLYNALMQEA